MITRRKLLKAFTFVPFLSFFGFKRKREFYAYTESSGIPLINKKTFTCKPCSVYLREDNIYLLSHQPARNKRYIFRKHSIMPSYVECRDIRGNVTVLASDVASEINWDEQKKGDIIYYIDFDEKGNIIRAYRMEFDRFGPYDKASNNNIAMLKNSKCLVNTTVDYIV